MLNWAIRTDIFLWGCLLISAWVVLAFGHSRSAFAELNAHGGPVKGIAVSKDGARALTASFDYSMILWNLADQSILAELHGHDAAVNAVSFTPDGRRALSASDDGTVGIWDLSARKILTRLKGHRGKVVAVAISPDGTMAASAGWDRTVRLWDLKSTSVVRTHQGADTLNAVAFSRDGQHVMAGASDGGLRVWRVEDGTQILAIGGHDFAVTGMDQGPDGEVVATSSVDETVQLWDIATGQALTTLYGHEGPVLTVALSDDGSLVASGGVDGTVRVWRRGDGDRLRVYARHQGPVWSVAFAPDGKTLLSGGADGLVLTYDLDREETEENGTETKVAAAEASTSPTTASRGEKLFKTCVACHTTEPDDGHKAGPTLHNLFGRIAGSHPGYHYSKTLRESDLVWTEETIDRLFDIGPDHLLPGTKMPLQRMPDPKDRADLIAFLKMATTP